MNSSSACSEAAAPPVLVAIEGMPGAGKTTAAGTLAADGACVLGEYTDEAASTIDAGRHPAAGDDAGHQANWLRKAAQCATLLAAGHRVVYADRDWLTSLAYAASLEGDAGARLLEQRAAWAAAHLAAGRLLMPAVYAVLDVDPATSLDRRAGRRRPGHPWDDPAALARLRRFYGDPPRALELACPQLAAALARPAWVRVSGTAPRDRVAAQLAAAGGRR